MKKKYVNAPVTSILACSAAVGAAIGMLIHGAITPSPPKPTMVTVTSGSVSASATPRPSADSAQVNSPAAVKHAAVQPLLVKPQPQDVTPAPTDSSTPAAPPPSSSDPAPAPSATWTCSGDTCTAAAPPTGSDGVLRPPPATPVNAPTPENCNIVPKPSECMGGK